MTDLIVEDAVDDYYFYACVRANPDGHGRPIATMREHGRSAEDRDSPERVRLRPAPLGQSDVTSTSATVTWSCGFDSLMQLYGAVERNVRFHQHSGKDADLIEAEVDGYGADREHAGTTSV